MAYTFHCDCTGMTWGRLYENCVDVPSTVAFLRGIGLLATDMQCCNAACNGQQMAERKLACKDGMTWRCLNKDCRRVKNIRTGSLFERSHLNLKQIILLVYFWTRNMLNQELIRHELDIRSSSTIVDWKNFIREVCELYFVLNPVQFDESGKTIY
ncbi:PREDICTED: uncharacterized protein LOC106806038 [Priapulus caudatus]|uniref:Uncharacterized protein LOC106806038 n=1 Tax=Priapulus caudatus TaxID=37621 RepID=A0ABM1DTU9_PRICU|nr:PREDICTED: uncharacterized protein LOC106806038 [Priapulus caudatus]